MVLVSSEGRVGESIPDLAERSFAGVFGIPWSTEVSPWGLPSPLHDSLPVYVRVCIRMSPLYKDASHVGLRTHITPV